MSLETVALEAFEHVAKERIDEYEAAAIEIDNRVRDTEPGMIVHVLTPVSENADSKTYRWLEVFQDVSALKAHFANPEVIQHGQKMSVGILNQTTDLVIYGAISEADRSSISGTLSAINLTFAEPVASFFKPR